MTCTTVGMQLLSFCAVFGFGAHIRLDPGTIETVCWFSVTFKKQNFKL